MARSGAGQTGITVQPSLFDMFYEEFLAQFMSAADPNEISQEFMKLKSDMERADFIMRLPFVRDFEIKNKAGIKCIEKAVKYREEGNKLFQSDQCTQAILFYNKSISYCPHPSYEQFQQGIEQEQEKVKEVQFADDIKEKDKGKRIPSKYESLSLSYGNRSAALRKLNQYEDCLRDIARAAKFGYPKANIYKLWERKGKCYEGLKRYDLAAKCYRQALQCVKESNLGEREKASKTGEIQGLLKLLRNTVETSSLPGQDEEEDYPEFKHVDPSSSQGASAPERPGRKATAKKPSPTTPNAQGANHMQKATSQVSISHISTTGSIRPDIEVPELTYGHNPRLPSASSAIDLHFSPERGRYFIATQDLGPGDVILREEPYAAVLESVFRVNHCAHCLRKTPTPIPCYECATVQYCTETCRDLSWLEYHSVECGILSYLEPSRCLGRLPHLALRIITKTGLQNLVRHTQAPLPNRDQVDPGLFDPTSYRSVHNLAANTDKRTFEDLLKKTAEAIFMAKCLKFNGFFGNPGSPTPESQRAEIFISSLLLRHLQVAATNGLEMAECILKNNDITKFDIIPVGGAIFPTMSFFNHSCYPNAMRLGYQNHQVVRVIRLIPKGGEVNIDYGFDFYATPIDYRQKRAGMNYHFKCDCVACSHKWPVYDRLVDRPPQYRKKLTPDLTMEIARQAANYQTAMEYLVRLDINKSIPILSEYLATMSELIVHPDARYLDCEEAYKQCLWLENRGFKVLKDKQVPKGLSNISLEKLKQ